MPNDLQLAWLAKMVPAAQTTARLWHVPASISLAQCILESSWGASQLSKRANNFFGVKAVEGQAYMEFPTREVINVRSVMQMADFARYGTAMDSFAAHAHLLCTLPRYHTAMLCCGSPNSFAQQLQTCGYSTSPTYAKSLIALMRELNLYQYDIAPAPGPEPAELASATATPTNSNSKQEAA